MPGISNPVTGLHVFRALDDLAELELRQEEVKATAQARELVGAELVSLGLTRDRDVVRLLQGWRSLRVTRDSEDYFQIALDRFPGLRDLPIETARLQLSEVAEKIGVIASDLHQVRTKISHVNGVLRPLAPGWSTRFKHERPDIGNFEKFEARRDSLLGNQVEGIEGLRKWQADAYEFFRSYMVVDRHNFPKVVRLPGTVGLSSQRIYSLHWNEFCSIHAEEIYKYASELADGTKPGLTKRASTAPSLADKRQLFATVTPTAEQQFKATLLRAEPPRVRIRVQLKSAQDPLVAASRDWNDRNLAREELAGWLLQFERLWGPHAERVQVTVEVTSPSGTSNIGLPLQSIESAAMTLPGAMATL